ncbi:MULTISPECIES: AMP-binding protein [unclassified Beijerinckia]|uniref:AMP-binding protein n=1 Tax=unclassified Beijerinckia TaxID=2638183 RepID=UPI000897AEEC|nr:MULTISPECIES: AMP-binding protein [unclassified Beijerinckia]MDH7795218.1 non-ribosomal peptide synthetase component E (peptide arylation enzyme) [Beijerinckia sp. GAS462]SEB92448.1 Non-ribosomal peptide synthetase component E (peptide arylation enzyme) [Beijerinckia sp. 28-YEA-48]
MGIKQQGATIDATSASAFGPHQPMPGVTYRSAEEARRHIDAGDWLDFNIGDSLRRTAKAHPAKTAIVDADRALTFADIDAQSESVAASLLALGLKPGDCALFQVGTCNEFFSAFYGCLKAGVVPVCTLPQYRITEMRHFAEKTNAKAIFVQADVNPNFDQVAFARELAEAVPSLAHVIVVRGSGIPSLADMATAFDVETARAKTAHVAPGVLDVAVFQLSGGSTNLPKIIPRMHGEYLGSARQLGQCYGLTGEDVTLWSLPLIHNAGTIFAVLPVTVDGRTLIMQPRVDIPEMLRLIERHGVTFTGSIGPIAPKLLEVKDIDRNSIRSLKQFFSLTRAEAVEAHVGLPVSQMFGMTEGMLFGSAPTMPAFVRHHTVGYPVSPGDEVRLLAPGTETEVAFGEIGELCFRGPTTLTGYVGDPETTAASFTSDGFFRTGDLLRTHHIEGRVCYSFEGRIKDNINRGGEKIGAEEVEGLVVQHPDISDVRVVAMPDPIYGEKVCAFLIMHAGRPTPSVAELGQFLLTLGVAKYKLPERVEVIDAFPLTKVGKADKAAMRALIAEKLARESTAQG